MPSCTNRRINGSLSKCSTLLIFILFLSTGGDVIVGNEQVRVQVTSIPFTLPCKASSIDGKIERWWLDYSDESNPKLLSIGDLFRKTEDGFMQLKSKVHNYQQKYLCVVGNKWDFTSILLDVYREYLR